MVAAIWSTSDSGRVKPATARWFSIHFLTSALQGLAGLPSSIVVVATPAEVFTEVSEVSNDDDDGPVSSILPLFLSNVPPPATTSGGVSAAAIDLLRRHSDISLVILDPSMPGMSGLETLPELRKVNSDVPVLVSSGYSESETLRLFSGHKIPGFLQKPYTSQRLVEQVQAALAV